MGVTLTIRDETTSGQAYHEMPLHLPSERLTVRELIRERVYQEVQDFNCDKDAQVFRGLVQPSDAERVLNGVRVEYRMKERQGIDWKAQFEKAVEAFTRRGFLVLLDHKQADDLDQEFLVGPKTEVSFVRLTLLVGG